MGATRASGFIGSRVGDADCGDDREDPSGLFRSEEVDQGDLPRVEGVEEGGGEGGESGGLVQGEAGVGEVGHVRLCHRRMPFVRAYPRESQEMVFDAHDRAFAFFKGACSRGIYDNMKTAVEAIFVGKARLYNRRFLQMCSHYLVEPVACTPVSGWEKGQVENQVGLVRERFFTPRLRFKNLDELNAWLLDKCIAYTKAHRHPQLTDQTISDVFPTQP